MPEGRGAGRERGREKGEPQEGASAAGEGRRGAGKSLAACWAEPGATREAGLVHAVGCSEPNPCVPLYPLLVSAATRHLWTRCATWTTR